MPAIRTLAAGMLVAAIAVLAIAVPASAHDQLISSSPAQNEQFATAPEKVTLTFSGQLLVLDDSMSGTVVMVVDQRGRDWVDGEVHVLGDHVTANLAPGMPDAGYQVRWQVISEDGHPISGVIPFTVGDAEPMSAASAPTGDADTTDASEPDASEQTGQEFSSALRLLLVGVGGAATAAGAFTLYRFLRRPRAAAAPPESGERAADERQ